MSISQNPLLGPMRGSAANFTTYKLKGQNVVRIKAFHPTNANTVRQQHHRAGFKLMVKVYHSFGGMADWGFPNRPAKQSTYNAFMAANLPNAIDTTSDVPKIDYHKLVVARGPLPMVTVTGASLDSTGVIVEYACSTNFGNEGATDIVVAFLKTTTGELAMARQERGKADKGFLLIQIEDLKVEEMECIYLFTTSADEKRASNSVFVEVGSL